MFKKGHANEAARRDIQKRVAQAESWSIMTMNMGSEELAEQGMAIGEPYYHEENFQGSLEDAKAYVEELVRIEGLLPDEGPAQESDIVPPGVTRDWSRNPNYEEEIYSKYYPNWKSILYIIKNS